MNSEPIPPRIKVLVRRAMKDAINKVAILSSDGDRSILGKVFNHFKQSLQAYNFDGWESARKGPNRLKDFRLNSAEYNKYVGKLLAVAFQEVCDRKLNNDGQALRNSLNSMKAILNEAQMINKQSEIVINKLSDIERSISDVG